MANESYYRGMVRSNISKLDEVDKLIISKRLESSCISIMTESECTKFLEDTAEDIAIYSKYLHLLVRMLKEKSFHSAKEFYYFMLDENSTSNLDDDWLIENVYWWLGHSVYLKMAKNYYDAERNSLPDYTRTFDHRSLPGITVPPVFDKYTSPLADIVQTNA